MRRDRSPFDKCLGLIIGVGFFLRLTSVLLTRNVAIDPQSDSSDYFSLGKRVAAGQWLTNTNGTSTFRRPPGYPLFLGAVIKGQHMFGLDQFPSRLVVGFVQAALAMVSIWLFGRLIKRRVPVHGSRAGLLTAGLLAISLDVFGWPAVILTESLFLPLFICGCCLLLWDAEPRLPLLIGGGAMFGACVLIRSASLVLVAAAVLVVASGLSRVSLQRGACVALGFGLVLAPWVVHAHHETGRLLIDTTVGQNLCLTSSEHANGQWNAGCNPPTNVDSLAYMDDQAASAWHWGINHPGRLASLRASVLASMLQQDSGSWANLFGTRNNPPLWAVAPIMLGGLALWLFLIVTTTIAFWRPGDGSTRRIAFFRQTAILTIAVMLVPFFTFHANRFNVGLIPFLYLSSAYWLCTSDRTLGQLVDRAFTSVGISEDRTDGAIRKPTAAAHRRHIRT